MNVDKESLKSLITLTETILGNIPNDNQFSTLSTFPVFGTNLRLLNQLFSKLDQLSPKSQASLMLKAPFDISAGRKKVLETADAHADEIVEFLSVDLKQLLPQLHKLYSLCPVSERFEE
ncbi:hypothetical protein HDV02_005173 [Globomyces sp. JEL0801]|nr:hypothetical protein HDV02_005173 [Globomyces sp. JEL0801]